MTYGVKFAFNLDGGGSTQTVVRGVNKILPYDGGGIDERLVPHFLYFAVEPSPVQNLNIDLENAYSDIGVVDEKADDITTKFYTTWNQGYLQIFAPTGYKTQGIEIWEGTTKKAKLNLREDLMSYYDYTNDRACFTVKTDGTITTVKGQLADNFSRLPVPTDLNLITISGTYWATMSVPNNPTGLNSFVVEHLQYDSQNALQIAYIFKANDGTVKKRRLAAGTWEAWF